MELIKALEGALSNASGRGVAFEKVFESVKPENVLATYASIDSLRDGTGFRPKTTIGEGI